MLPPSRLVSARAAAGLPRALLNRRAGATLVSWGSHALHVGGGPAGREYMRSALQGTLVRGLDEAQVRQEEIDYAELITSSDDADTAAHEEQEQQAAPSYYAANPTWFSVAPTVAVSSIPEKFGRQWVVHSNERAAHLGDALRRVVTALPVPTPHSAHGHEQQGDESTFGPNDEQAGARSPQQAGTAGRNSVTGASGGRGAAWPPVLDVFSPVYAGLDTLHADAMHLHPRVYEEQVRMLVHALHYAPNFQQQQHSSSTSNAQHSDVHAAAHSPARED